MPTANAEDPCRSGGSLKTRLTETFPTLPSDPISPLGVPPSACAETVVRKVEEQYWPHVLLAPRPVGATTSVHAPLDAACSGQNMLCSALGSRAAMIALFARHCTVLPRTSKRPPRLPTPQQNSPHTA